MQAMNQRATGRPARFVAPADSGRDYRTIYAALYRFHERHVVPPAQEALDDQYLAEVADDYWATAAALDNDPFALDLLLVAVEELTRQYNAMRGRSEPAAGCNARHGRQERRATA